MFKNAFRRALPQLIFLFAAFSAAAATNQIKTAIDTDNNASTGCSVVTASGTFSGAEQLLITSYDPDAHAVTSVIRQRCTGGTFGGGDMIDAGGWAVGTTGGVNLIETHIPWDALGATGPMRLGFVITSDTLSDSVLQRPGGAPIMFPGSLGSGRHHVVSPGGEHSITLDGDGRDWGGVAPIAAAGSASSSPALRFLSVSLTQSDTDFFLRFDVQSNPQAPTAVDDSYSTLRGGTLTVAAPGVLANDHDPNAKPLTAVLISGPQHGNLTLNADGGFTYVNDNSPAPTDSFRYKANNGSADSNTAFVTLTIISGTAPAITSANHATFSVGTPGTFLVTATGNPTPSLSMTGALPSGVTFNPSTGQLSGTPAAGTGKQYALTFTATNAVGTTSQSFTLTVNQAPTITSANATTMLVGTAGSFTVTATGFPLPAFSETGALPAGVTFNTTTHVLGGTPTATGIYPISFTVTNPLGTNTQSFTLTVNQTPAITSANATTFTVGTLGTFTVTATGFPTPTLSETGTLPNGVTFNAGTGVLSGTPAAGTGGTYAISFSATNTAGTATQNFTLTVNEAPAITSANATTFLVGTAGSFTVTATGFPAPTIAEAGGLPAGVTYDSTTHVLSGTPTASGIFPITFTASNGVGAPAVQGFTLTVNEAPSITSANNATFTVGTLGNFTPTATGFPAPTITETGALPNGVTFTAGVLSGTPAAGTGGVYNIAFHATNVAGTANQNFTLTVNEAPSITSANATTFAVGSAGTFTVTATGFPAPNIAEAGALPSGVTYDSTTHVLAGTPASGTGGTYSITFTASNGVGAPFVQGFTLTVNEAPSITSANNATFTVGTLGNFTPTATGFPAPTITETGALPNGVTFTAGSLTGTPQPGTGGTYSITFHATNVAGTANQSFTLTVNEAPAITSANNATFLVGSFGTFTVTATGFPAPSIAESGALPSGVTYDSVTHILSGTPGSGTAGTYPMTFTATNGVGGPAVQTFTLAVNEAPAITSANATTFTVGTLGTFTVTATGFPAPALSETGALPGGVTFNNLTGVLSGTPNAGTGGIYNITFHAANIVNTANQSFTLTVNEAPAVTLNPSSQSVCSGLSASFTASAIGFPAPTVQWQVSTDNGVSFNNVPGATSTTLSFTTAPTDNGNQYRAVFTNGSGTATTTAATLTVNSVATPVALSAVPGSGSAVTITWSPSLCATSYRVFRAPASGGPYVTVADVAAPGTSFTDVFAGGFIQYYVVEAFSATQFSPASNEVSATNPFPTQTVCAGATASFTSTATSTPAPTVQWQSSPDGITFTDIPGATSTTLSFATAAADNGKFYHAVFTGPFGTATSDNAQLTVNTAPAVTTDPLSHAACENTTTSFTAAASGQPTPTVQWQSSPDGITFTDISGATSTTYSFIPTLADNNHQYRAVFTNTCGTATTAAATLTVEEPLTITTQPTDQSVQANTTATFTAASSSPTATVQWQVSTDGGTIFTDIPGATSTTLSFTTSISQNGNKYHAVFTNSCGTATTNAATLTVTCVPPTVSSSPNPLPHAVFNIAYVGNSITASGGIGPYTFAVTGGTFPPGLNLASNGTISGAPTATGTFNFTVTATDTATNCNTPQAFQIVADPHAQNDSYGTTLVNNTQAFVSGGLTSTPTTPAVSLTGSIISNDFPSGSVAASAGTFATTAGGSVTIATDGTFLYTPPVTTNAITSDSFTYTILSDTGGTGTPGMATGTVNLTLAGRVWYVKNDAAGGGNGQSQAPFNSLASFVTAPRSGPDKANDIIFVFTGDGNTTNQTNGIQLIDTETLWGQGLDLVVNSITLVTAGAKPQITNSNATSNACTLGNGDTVKGLTFTNATRSGVTGANVSNFTGDNLLIQNNGVAGLELSNVSGTVTVTNTTIGNNSSFNLWISNGTATINVDNTNTINSSSNQRDVVIDNRPLAAGNITIGATINDNGGTGFDIQGNQSGIIAFTGTQTIVGGIAANPTAFASNTGATINFTGNLSITTTNQPAFTASGGGTYNVTGTATLQTGTANALDLSGITVGASGITFGSINVTTNSISAINLASLLGTGTITVNGGTLRGQNGVTLNTMGTTTLTLSGVTISNPTISGITGTTGGFGTLTLNTVTINTPASVPAVQLTNGTLGGTGSTIASGGPGLILNTVTFAGGTSFNSISSSGGTNGISLTTVSGSASVTGGTLSGASGATFLVSGGNPSFTYGGNITQNTAGQRVVDIASTTANTIALSGTITSTAGTTGVVLTTVNGNVTFGTLALGTNAARMTNTAVSITGGTGTYSLGTVGIFTNGATGIVATNADGTINSSTGTVDATGAGAISIVGPPGLTSLGLTLTTVNSTGGTNGVNLFLTNGSISVTGGALSGATGATFNVATSSVGGTFGGTITQATAGQPVVNISAHTTGTLAFSNSITTTNGTGIQIFAETGTLNFTGQLTIDGTTQGVNITGTSTGTINFSNAASTIGATTSPSAVAFTVNGGTPVVVYAGTIRQTNGAAAVTVASVTGGNTAGPASPYSILFSGAINKSGIAANALSILSNTGGSFGFTGAITASTSTFTAINLVTNAGATIKFTGALDLTTNGGVAVAFNATFGGTVIATGAGSNLTSAGAAAVNIQNTTIGTGGVNFESVSANGGANGIVLNTTGAGAFTVTGDGASDPANTTRGNTTAKSGGGTITLGSGGTIQNTTGSGVLLTTTGPVSLTSMNILNAGASSVNTGNNGITATTVNGLTLDNVKITGSTGNSGLRGTSVTNLQMQHVDIDGNGTVVGTETNDNWNVRLDDLAGNCGNGTAGCGWNNSLFFNSRENIVGLKQGITNTTVNTSMTITNCEFRDTTTFASPANDAFGVSTFNSAVTNILATGSTFKNVEVTGFQYAGNDNSSGIVKVQNSVFENTGTDINIAHGGGSGGNSTLTFDISGNTERQLTGNPASTVAVNVFLAGNSGASSLMTGTIKNNTIGNPAVSGSGSHVGDGIDINATGAGTITATVTGNTVRQIFQGEVFFAEANSGSAHLNVFVHNNTFNTDTGTSVNGLDAMDLTGSAVPTDSSTLCADIALNTLIGDQNYTSVVLQNLGNASSGIRLVGLSNTFNDNTTAIANFVGSNGATTPPGVNTNVNPTPNSGFMVIAGGHITGVANCGITFPP